MHNSCYITISSSAHLKKAQQRKQNEIAIVQCSGQASTSDVCDDVPEVPPPPKRLGSLVGGPLHDKTKCVWCMKGDDTQHPNKTQSKIFRLNTLSGRRAF